MKSRRSNFFLWPASLVTGLLLLHVALPCKTNSLGLSNNTDRTWAVELGVCGKKVWAQEIAPRANLEAGFEMVCGESSISVTTVPIPSSPSTPLVGEFGYLQQNIPGEGTVVIEPTGLRYEPEPLPSLLELALAQFFGTTRCWAD